jgi:predicted AAA+ superfamily ATPase
MNNMDIDWKTDYAAVWRREKETMRPVKAIDPVSLRDLVCIDNQKEELVKNTERFLKGEKAHNALLWGATGTGKSSLVKAVFNEFKSGGLRIVEVNRYDLIYFPEIVDRLRSEPFHFIIYSDDLSFDEGEEVYRGIKSVLEGSIELPPENVLIYVTSNRRHLVPEYMEENRNTVVRGGEIHYADTVEEKISLSHRFGLWIPFPPVSMENFLKIVDSYFTGFTGDWEELHNAARRFSVSRASRSGRTAKQFAATYSHE